MTRQDGQGIVQLVGHAGQELTHGRELLALGEVLLESLSLGDVLLDRDEVGDLTALVVDRRDRLRLGVEAAVFASIDHLASPRLPAQNGFPETPVERRLVLSGLLQAQRPAHDLRDRIAGEAGEGRIGPDDGSAAIRDDDAAGGGVQGAGLQAHLLLGQLAFGDVAQHPQTSHHLALSPDVRHVRFHPDQHAVPFEQVRLEDRG